MNRKKIKWREVEEFRRRGAVGGRRRVAIINSLFNQSSVVSGEEKTNQECIFLSVRFDGSAVVKKKKKNGDTRWKLKRGSAPSPLIPVFFFFIFILKINQSKLDSISFNLLPPSSFFSFSSSSSTPPPTYFEFFYFSFPAHSIFSSRLATSRSFFGKRHPRRPLKHELHSASPAHMRAGTKKTNYPGFQSPTVWKKRAVATIIRQSCGRRGFRFGIYDGSNWEAQSKSRFQTLGKEGSKSNQSERFFVFFCFHRTNSFHFYFFIWRKFLSFPFFFYSWCYVTWNFQDSLLDLFQLRFWFFRDFFKDFSQRNEPPPYCNIFIVFILVYLINVVIDSTKRLNLSPIPAKVID